MSAHSLASDKEVDRITVLHSVEGFALVMLCRYSCFLFPVVFLLHAHKGFVFAKLSLHVFGSLKLTNRLLIDCSKCGIRLFSYHLTED